jgi:hypothetical protein
MGWGYASPPPQTNKKIHILFFYIAYIINTIHKKMKHYRSRSNLRRSRKPKSRNNRRQRTYRYRGGAAGGPAGAAKRAQIAAEIAAKRAQIAAEIAAVDAGFNAAMGGKVSDIKLAIKQTINAGSSKEAKDRALSLMGSLNRYSPTRVVNAVMLAANQATADAAAAAARTGYLERHVLGDRPNSFGTPLVHSGNSKSQPAKHASPKHSH